MPSRTPLLLLLGLAFCAATAARAAWPAPQKVKDLINQETGPSGWDPHAVPGGFCITYHREDGRTPAGAKFYEVVIWASDGTAAGTVKLDYALVGGPPSRREFDRTGRRYPTFLGGAGHKVPVIHRTDADAEEYLWIVDIKKGRSVRVGSPGPFATEQPTPQVLDDSSLLYLKTESGAVWQSDATTAGTRRVADIAGAGMNWGILQQQVVLDANRETSVGLELYRHSIATSTTTLIEDFRPGMYHTITGRVMPFSSYPRDFMLFQDRLYFGVSTPQPTLYRINAKLLAPQVVSESVTDFSFAGTGIVLNTWMQDQTFVVLSSDLQHTVNLGTFPEPIEWVIQGDRNLFIIGQARQDHTRLAWLIDGTAAGKREMVIPGDVARPRFASDFIGVGRRLFFRGTFEVFTPSNADQLIGVDFDRKEVKRLAGGFSGDTGKLSLPAMTSFNGSLYVVLHNAINGYSLYRFDMSGFDQAAAGNWMDFE